MTKLNQIVAIEKGVKSDIYSAITTAYHRLQKTPLFGGRIRTYQPLEDDGEVLPDESEVVQADARTVLEDVSLQLARLFDVTATKDVTNTRTTADVVVDGEILVTGVPVTYLLFLEKQLKDLKAFILKLPTLDPTKKWAYDLNDQIFKSEPVVTSKTKKVPKTHVKAAATDKHPAQTETYWEDVTVGHWTTVHLSGAVPAGQVRQLLTRVDALAQAVKMAREGANMVDVVDMRGTGKKVMDWLLAPL